MIRFNQLHRKLTLRTIGVRTSICPGKEEKANETKKTAVKINTRQGSQRRTSWISFVRKFRAFVLLKLSLFTYIDKVPALSSQ
jgi:hypothetical protein